jgi:hypothetical protein
MATKKVKRYSGEDGESEVSVPEEGTGAQEETFADAFKRNRSRGEKTFEFKGKKYTTETAEDKAKAKKAKDEEETKAQAERVKGEKGIERVSPELDLLPMGKLLGGAAAAATAMRLGKRAVDAAKATRSAKRAEEAATATKAARAENAAASGAMKGEARAGELRYKRGGGVKSASARADGCCIRGKTRA